MATHLDDFCHAILEFPRRQRLEQGGVDEDVLWLMEGADEVLAERHVDGRLATDSRVDHSEQGRRYLDVAHSSHERRRDETYEVTDDTSTQCDEDGIPRTPLSEEDILDVCLSLPRFGLFAGRNGVRDDASCGGGIAEGGCE